ncbi:hypothetical protein A8709_29150 [Paenibacillus pectinilyticus]|uniref:VOC domain-containing protein n=1 Tax=Paenibacillus pectinilyticus TaxID=512399 RepID=A0A1C0ZUZ6_9BACL|nr:VOC family protein [Paenibacillus pectinilyticus]OCT11932.1 hypothetical protein A8709_29150 [Paenibacillus pectinilyticus]
MELKQIHHVAIICSDYERSKHFYVDVLGLPTVRIDPITGNRDTFFADPDGLPLELVEHVE